MGISLENRGGTLVPTRAYLVGVVPSQVGSGPQTLYTNAAPTTLTYTTPATAGVYRLSAYLDVLTAGTLTFKAKITYTDPGGSARTDIPAFYLQNTTAVLAGGPAANTVGQYIMIPYTIAVNNAGNTISIADNAGTYTAGTYYWTPILEQLAQMQILVNPIPQNANTTGASTATAPTNSPATVNSNPYTWIKTIALDGTAVFIPAWKQTGLKIERLLPDFGQTWYYDPTTAGLYPLGRLGLIDSNGVFKDLFHLDGANAPIFGTGFSVMYLEAGLSVLVNSPSIQLANSAQASTPVFQLDMGTNQLRVQYSQQGSPSQAQHELLEAFAASDPVYFKLNNNAGTERIAMRAGTAGNRGVLKIWDVTAAAYKYAYIDNGAWVIAASEPT